MGKKIQCQHIKESVLKEDLVVFLKKDVLKKYFKKDDSYICIRHSILFNEFINNFPLKYQRNDKLIVTIEEFIDAMNIMDVCSTFKMNKKNINRFKLLKHKLSEL